MRPFASRCLTLAICATAAVAIPVATATDSEASGQHVRKHHHRANVGWNNSVRRSWADGDIRAAAPSWNGGGDICPGNARAIDCKIWPPPIDVDPDRKISGSDGGG